MKSFQDLMNINDFEIKDMDLSDIQKLENKLPKTGVFDLNIAEMGLVYTLEGQNLCQDKIAKIDRYIGYLAGQKNKSWSKAALETAKDRGYKTAKDKEWFAQSDDDYISFENKITMAKAAKKWLESKASYFSGWHYAFKTFLRRDYSIENISGINNGVYNDIVDGGRSTEDIVVDENDIDWS